MAIPKENRLRSPKDFSRVHRKGKRAATKNLALRALKPQPQQPSRQPSKRLNRLKKDESVDENSSAFLLCLPPTPSCFGISISKKVSKRAVVRNRIKRQLKAVIQRYLPMIEPGWQVVIVVRPSAVECSFDEFLRELEYLLKKLGIVTLPEGA